MNNFKNCDTKQKHQLQQQNEEKKKQQLRCALFVLEHTFQIRPTRPDGNCLFESVSMSLQYIYNFRISIEQLRKIIARRVLDVNDSEATQVCLSWITLANEYWKEMALRKNFKSRTNKAEEQTYMEYTHLENINGVRDVRSNKDLTSNIRFQLYNNLLRSSFWGETFCLSSLTKYLGIKFYIVDGSRIRIPKDGLAYKYSTQKCTCGSFQYIYVPCLHLQYLEPFLLFHHDDNRFVSYPRKEIWLYLDHNHYQPLFPHSH